MPISIASIGSSGEAGFIVAPPTVIDNIITCADTEGKLGQDSGIPISDITNQFQKIYVPVGAKTEFYANEIDSQPFSFDFDDSASKAQVLFNYDLTESLAFTFSNAVKINNTSEAFVEENKSLVPGNIVGSGSGFFYVTNSLTVDDNIILSTKASKSDIKFSMLNSGFFYSLKIEIVRVEDPSSVERFEIIIKDVSSGVLS